MAFFGVGSDWYLSPMRFLGWLETIIKIGAWFVLLSSLLGWIGPDKLMVAPVEVWQAALPAVLLTALLAVGVYDRYLDQEIFGMFFICINLPAHASVAYWLTATATGLEPFIGYSAGAIGLWALVMLTADLIKLFSIYHYGMRVRELPVPLLYLLTIVFMTSYVLIIFGLNPTS